MAQRFDSFSVRRFKGTADIEFEQLGAFNVFLGANNTGKTSLLEAVFLLAGMSNLQLPIVIHNQRNYLVRAFEDLSYLFHDLDMDTPIELCASSSDPEETRELLISAVDGSVVTTAVQHVNGDDGTARHGNGTAARSSSAAFGSRVLRYEGTMKNSGSSRPRSFKAELSFDAGEIEISPPPTDALIHARLLRPGLEYDNRIIADVIVNKKNDELVEILGRIDPRIQDIGIRDNVAYLDVGLERMMPLNMFGSGMLRAVNMLSYCLVGDTKVLLIDEIENGLHYKGILPLLRALLTLSAERGVQIFSTAHSIEILQGLREVLLDPEFAAMRSTTTYHVLAKDAQDLLRAYRYDYPQFDHCIENGIEIR